MSQSWVVFGDDDITSTQKLVYYCLCRFQGSMRIASPHTRLLLNSVRSARQRLSVRYAFCCKDDILRRSLRNVRTEDIRPTDTSV